MYTNTHSQAECKTFRFDNIYEWSIVFQLIEIKYEVLFIHFIIIKPVWKSKSKSKWKHMDMIFNGIEKCFDFFHSIFNLQRDNYFWWHYLQIRLELKSICKSIEKLKVEHFQRVCVCMYFFLFHKMHFSIYVHRMGGPHWHDWLIDLLIAYYKFCLLIGISRLL